MMHIIRIQRQYLKHTASTAFVFWRNDMCYGNNFPASKAPHHRCSHTLFRIGEIRKSKGQRMAATSRYILPVQKLDPGYYTVMVRTEKGIITRPVMKY